MAAKRKTKRKAKRATSGRGVVAPKRTFKGWRKRRHVYYRVWEDPDDGWCWELRIDPDDDGTVVDGGCESRNTDASGMARTMADRWTKTMIRSARIASDRK